MSLKEELNMSDLSLVSFTCYLRQETSSIFQLYHACHYLGAIGTELNMETIVNDLNRMEASSTSKKTDLCQHMMGSYLLLLHVVIADTLVMTISLVVCG